MPSKGDRIATRIVVPLLAALTLPTFAAAALAQAEPEKQKTPAREASKPDAVPISSALQITDLEVAIQTAADREAEPTSLVHPEAALLFPTTDAPAASDSEAAKAPASAAAVSKTAWIVIAVAAAAAAAVLIFVEPG